MNTTDLHNDDTVHVAGGAPEARNGTLTVGDAPGLGDAPGPDVLGAPVAAYD